MQTSFVMAKCNLKVPTESFLDIITLMNDRPISAGYPGEDHKGWDTVTLYSSTYGLAQAALSKTDIVDFFENSGLCITLARFMSLASGGIISQHRDIFLGGKNVRLHIPLQTNPHVQFYIDGELCKWRKGEMWFGDFSKVHWGKNDGNEKRIHLVLDVELNNNLLDILEDDSVRSILHGRMRLAESAYENIRQLERFCVALYLPEGFSLQGAKRLAATTPASICIMAGELVVKIGGQPMLMAQPASNDTLNLVGLHMEARLFYKFDDDRPVRVSLIIEKKVINLPLDV